jgi:hypothetical protein
MAERSEPRGAFGQPLNPQGGFLIPDQLRNNILAIQDNAVPVEPREHVVPLEAAKASYYLSVSPELLEDLHWTDGIPGMMRIALGTATPEEIAAREERRARWQAERDAKHAAAVAEWEQVRQRYADSPAVLAVLDIHQPTDDLECDHPVAGYEAWAEDWPCGTYQAIKGAVQ